MFPPRLLPFLLLTPLLTLTLTLTLPQPPLLHPTDPPVTPKSPPSPTHPILSPLHPPSSLTTEPETYCRLDDSSWAPDGMLMEHCTAALHRFYVMQVGPHIDQDYEFLAHDARPMYKPVQQVAVTPRKYSVGSCVLAITMINFYHADLLPERGPGPFPDNDVTKWGKLWWAMHNIIFGCKGPGWAAVGDRHKSIGVFVWTRFSAMDRATPSGTFAKSSVSNSNLTASA